MTAKSWADISPQSRGRLIIFVGVLAVTPDSMIIKFLERHGVDGLSILVWKLLFMGIFSSAFAMLRSGGLKGVAAGLKPIACYVPVLTIVTAVVEIGFTLSVCYTTAANALLFLSLNPLWAALLAFFVLKERPPLRTLVSLILALTGVVLIFVPAILDEVVPSEPDYEDGKLLGDLLALATGIALAVQITLTRYLGSCEPQANLTAALSIGPFLGSFLALVIAILQGIAVLPGPGGWDLSQPAWQYWTALLADGACLAALFAALSIAPALISGPEVGLVMLLEAAIGPLWVFLAFGEVPSPWTFAGGSVLVLTLAVNEILAMRCCRGKDAPKVDLQQKPLEGAQDLEMQQSSTDESSSTEES